MNTYWLALWLIFADSQINAEMLMLDSSSKCGKEYDTMFTESVDITFKGGWSINGSCVISFLNNATNDFDIGVKILSSTLDCTTVIEYHKHFVSNYMHDGIITCKMNNATGYKLNITQMSKLYIVFKKTEDNNGYMTDFERNEKAYIHMYRLPRYAEQPIEEGPSYLLLGFTIYFGIFIILLSVIKILFMHKRKKNGQYTKPTDEVNLPDREQEQDCHSPSKQEQDTSVDDLQDGNSAQPLLVDPEQEQDCPSPSKQEQDTSMDVSRDGNYAQPLFDDTEQEHDCPSPSKQEQDTSMDVSRDGNSAQLLLVDPEQEEDCPNTPKQEHGTSVDVSQDGNSPRQELDDPEQQQDACGSTEMSEPNRNALGRLSITKTIAHFFSKR